MTFLYLQFEDGSAMWINLKNVKEFFRSTSAAPHAFQVLKDDGDLTTYQGIANWEVQP